MTRRILIGFVLACGVAALAAVGADLHGPVRAVPAAAFFLVGPGLAVVGHVGVDDLGLEVGLAAAASVAIACIASVVGLAVGGGAPLAAFAAVTVASSGSLLALGLRRP